MTTTTLAIFSIAASILIFEGWVDEFRTYWPELGLLLHLSMAAALLALLWAVAVVVAFFVLTLGTVGGTA